MEAITTNRLYDFLDEENIMNVWLDHVVMCELPDGSRVPVSDMEFTENGTLVLKAGKSHD